MTIALAILGLLLGIGAAERLARELRTLNRQLQLLAWAALRSAKATDESILTAKAQLEMNRQLVETVRSRPPASPVGPSFSRN